MGMADWVNFDEDFGSVAILKRLSLS